MASFASAATRVKAPNTNGLIRDFFPKGTDFSTIANAEVAKVERLLNARPRKSLGFRSPQEVFDSLAHS
jgi:IS30 family transposase